MILGALERALASTESSFLTRVKDVSKDQPEYAVGGASLVAAIVTATDVYVINLGDSRAVIVRGEEVGRGWRGVLRKGAGVGGGGSASLVSGRRRSGEGGRGRGGSGGWGSGGRGEGEGSGSSKGSGRREKVGETGDIWEKGEKWERGEISGAVGAMESAGSRGAGGGEAGGGEKGGGRGGGVWRWKAERLTVDHNTSNAAEVRRVQQAHADSDVIKRGRLKGKIKLTRAFGAAYLKDVSAYLKDVSAYLKDVSAYLKDVSAYLKDVSAYLKDPLPPLFSHLPIAPHCSKQSTMPCWACSESSTKPQLQLRNHTSPPCRTSTTCESHRRIGSSSSHPTVCISTCKPRTFPTASAPP
ncbi:unnamed protein product [Closterium sp. NIES-65]|nr:unnamed protein product [Closterium sp. NIES-65]